MSLYMYVGMCVYKLVSICIMLLDGLKHAENVTEYTIKLNYKHIIIIFIRLKINTTNDQISL